MRNIPALILALAVAVIPALVSADDVAPSTAPSPFPAEGSGNASATDPGLSPQAQSNVMLVPTPPPERPPPLPLRLAAAPNAPVPPAAVLEVNFTWPVPPPAPQTNNFRADLDTAVTFGLTSSMSDMKAFGPGCQHTWSIPRSEAVFSGDDAFSPGLESYRFALSTDAPVPPIRLSAAWFMAAPPDARDLLLNVSVSVSVTATGTSTSRTISVSTAEMVEACAAWYYRSSSSVGADVAHLDVSFHGGEPALVLSPLEELLPSMEAELSSEPTVEPTTEEGAQETFEDGVFQPAENGTSGSALGGLEEETWEEGKNFATGEYEYSGLGNETVASPQPDDAEAPDYPENFGPDRLHNLSPVLITFAWPEGAEGMDTSVQASGEGAAMCGFGGTGFSSGGRPKIVTVDIGMGAQQQYAVSLEKAVMAPGAAVLEIMLSASWTNRQQFAGALANVTVQYKAAGAAAAPDDGAPQTTTFNPVAERPGRVMPYTPCQYNKIGKVRVTRDARGTVDTQTFVYARQT